MKKFRKVLETKEVLNSLICDRCNKEYFDDLEIQEFISIERFCGYGSIFGDENIIKVDLCQYCQDKLFGDFLRKY